MSKTVKRVMRVMMIGLVALPGAKAEAHYYIVAGKVKYCDICLALDLRDVPDPFAAVVESKAEEISLELLCPSGIEITDVASVVGIQELPIPPTITKNGKAQVVFRFTLPPLLCSDGVTVPDPDDEVIIRAVDVVNARVCDGRDSSNPCGDGTRNNTTISTYMATDCELPSAYNFGHLPSEGTRLGCGTQVIMHHPFL